MYVLHNCRKAVFPPTFFTANSDSKCCKCFEICYNHMDTQLVAIYTANVLRDVLMIRDGLLEFSSDLFEYSELDDFCQAAISELIYIFSRLIFFNCFLMLYIMYDFHIKIINTNK